MTLQRLTTLACILTAGCLAACFSLRGQQSPPELSAQTEADSLASKLLGADAKRAIFEPATVSCRLMRLAKTGTGQTVYRSDSLALRLTADECAVIRYLLPLNAANYRPDEAKPQAPYLPVLSLTFRGKGKAAATVIISVSDRTWHVLDTAGCELFACGYAESASVARFVATMKAKLEALKDRKGGGK